MLEIQAFHIFDLFHYYLYLKNEGRKSMYNYEVQKGTVLRSRVDGKYFYIVDL